MNSIGYVVDFIRVRVVAENPSPLRFDAVQIRARIDHDRAVALDRSKTAGLRELFRWPGKSNSSEETSATAQIGAVKKPISTKLQLG
jgi:hypothetical protein